MNRVSEIKSYRHWLAEELCRRKSTNPHYSLNAFSRSLKISPATLSQVISGKRRLGRQSAQKIVERCALSPKESYSFMSSVFEELLPSGKVTLEKDTQSLQFKELELEKFQMISNWYHFAIINMGGLKKNKSDPEWIAQQLGITKRQAQGAFERLLKLRLIEKQGEGFVKGSEPLWVKTEKNSTAIRKYHQDNLEKAKEALDDEEVSLELYSSVTMLVDEDKLELARKKINRFRNRLTKELSSDEKGKRVFTLAVQLFPVSKGENNK